MNRKLHIAGFAVAIAIPLTACGGGGTPAASANGGTRSTANGGPVTTISSNAADVQACTNLQKTATAFLANKNQDTLDAFAAALAARPGAAMSPSLDALSARCPMTSRTRCLPVPPRWRGSPMRTPSRKPAPAWGCRCPPASPADLADAILAKRRRASAVQLATGTNCQRAGHGFRRLRGPRWRRIG